MREFKERPFGNTVDLDDPKTYEHLPNTVDELDKLMFKHIGYATVYMDYFPNNKGLFSKRRRKPEMVEYSEGVLIDINNVGYEQRKRVEELIKNFATNRRDHYNDVMWYKEQIFLFHDEIENMC